jgi:hypothetical protein
MLYLETPRGAGSMGARLSGRRSQGATMGIEPQVVAWKSTSCGGRVKGGMRHVSAREPASKGGRAN